MAVKKKFFKTKPHVKVTFSLPESAARATSDVRIVGEFNDWKWEHGIPMKNKDGFYIANMELERDKEFEFRYLIDNQMWENDWRADDYRWNPYGEENSVVSTMSGEPEL